MAPEEEDEVAAGEQAKLNFDMTINPTTPPVSTKVPSRHIAMLPTGIFGVMSILLQGPTASSLRLPGS